MSNKYPSVGYKPKLDDNATVIEGSSITTNDNSEWFDLGDCLYWGVAIGVGTVTGTTPVMTCKAECRFNGESDTYALPGDINTTTQISMATYSTTDENKVEFFRNMLPTMGEYGQARLAFTVSGTTPVFPITQCVIIKVAR